jgi:hypothetical protein
MGVKKSQWTVLIGSSLEAALFLKPERYVHVCKWRKPDLLGTATLCLLSGVERTAQNGCRIAACDPKETLGSGFSSGLLSRFHALFDRRRRWFQAGIRQWRYPPIVRTHATALEATAAPRNCGVFLETEGNIELRWCVPFLGLLCLMPMAPAFAGTQVNGCGRYSVWVPDNWKVTFNNERLTAESRDDDITLVVSPLKDKEADLTDEDVTDFIDDEIDDMKVTSDRRDKIAGIEARIVEGTATDDGNISFKAVALDPSENDAVIELLVYGAPEELNKGNAKAAIDQIVRSFKPFSEVMTSDKPPAGNNP